MKPVPKDWINKFWGKFKRLARKPWREYLWRLRVLGTFRSGIQAEAGISPKVIVSFTATPSRLFKVYITVESLLNQTKRPHRIVIWLPDSLRSQKLPWLLRKQTKRGLTIRFCEDLGAYKKIYYALKEFPGDIIVTCDDDRIYPKDWLQGLYETHLKDAKSVICYRAHEMLFDEEGVLKSYNAWKIFSPGLVGPSHKLFATGTGGVLYPPGSLHKEVLNKELFLRICPKNDDIWLKAMAMLKGAPHRKVKPYFTDVEFPTVEGSQQATLWSYNKLKNDEQIKAVFGHFQLGAFFSPQKERPPGF
jgi:hypothetical protein